MDINRSNMDALFATFQTAFAAGMTRGRAIPAELASEYLSLADLAMTVPSSGASVIHGWLNQIPGFRLWTGDRQKKNIGTKKLEVVNVDFEDTVAVNRNDIEDDQYGVYAPLFDALGAEGGDDALWLDRAMDALIGNGTWIDNKAFFATDRVYGANTINNLGTVALSTTTLNTALVAMQSYKSPESQPLNVVPVYLVVGPALRNTAWDLVKNQFVSLGSGRSVAGAVQNATLGRALLRVHPKLTGDYANYWYLLGQKGGIKPVGVQKRRAAALVRKDSVTDDNVFFNKEFIYGADARGEAFLTLPHLAYAGQVAP